jgi:hypothetical protein
MDITLYSTEFNRLEFVYDGLSGHKGLILRIRLEYVENKETPEELYWIKWETGQYAWEHRDTLSRKQIIDPTRMR